IETLSDNLAVALLQLDADGTPPQVAGGEECRTRSRERVSDNAGRALLDKAFHERYGFRRWMGVPVGAGGLVMHEDVGPPLPREPLAEDVNFFVTIPPGKSKVTHAGIVAL